MGVRTECVARSVRPLLLGEGWGEDAGVSPRSGRLKIAHRFIGGINPDVNPESVQRTTDLVISRLQPSASRTDSIDTI
jgi:hypothetical protein